MLTKFGQNAKARIRIILWVLVCIGLIASLVLALERYRTEQSTKKVEFVFDYRDLLEIADYRNNPQAFIDQQLDQMKKSNITGLAVYESTLSELRVSRRIELYNARDAAALTQKPLLPDKNFTYVLFSESANQAEVKTMIETGFQSIGVATRAWSFKNQQGLEIELPMDEASLKPLTPDFITMRTLKDKGFHLVVRLSNRRSLNLQDMDTLLSKLANTGVKTIVVDGDSVPGYGYTTNAKSTSQSIAQVAQLLNKYKLGLATIELQKVQQKGFLTLAKETNFNVLRLHSFTENDADKLSASLTKQELDSRIQGVADRFVLAVKDRNIRMVLLNARPSKNTDKATFADPLAPIYQSLIGPDGAVKRIKQAGFVVGEPRAFTYEQAPFANALKWLAVIGSVALITLTAAAFVPALAVPVFGLGLIGSLLLQVVATEMTYKLLALAVAISASTLALTTAIAWLRDRASALPTTGRSTIGPIIYVLLRTTFISLTGAVFVVGLLNHIFYNLQLDQFRGVKILAYMPILLTVLYLLFFSERLTGPERIAKLRKLLFSKVSVLWILTAGLLLGAGMYYLSRTGNDGQASSLELVFRSFLENTLSVRPRTKEFLIGHPLFIIGAYLVLKKQINGLYLVLIGAVAQADIVGTFTHLHTPLNLSVIRVAYGLILGSAIGFAAIVFGKVVARSWKRWLPNL